MPDRPTSNPQQFVQGSAVLHVPDIKATATYYRDVLGFNWDFGDETYSVVWRDNAAIHFAEGETVPTGVHVFLWVRDVDECHRQMAERGAEIVVPIGDRPYSMRDFAIRDPNGIDLIFGQDI